MYIVSCGVIGPVNPPIPASARMRVSAMHQTKKSAKKASATHGLTPAARSQSTRKIMPPTTPATAARYDSGSSPPARAPSLPAPAYHQPRDARDLVPARPERGEHDGYPGARHLLVGEGEDLPVRRGVLRPPGSRARDREELADQVEEPDAQAHFQGQQVADP